MFEIYSSCNCLSMYSEGFAKFNNVEIYFGFNWKTKKTCNHRFYFKGKRIPNDSEKAKQAKRTLINKMFSKGW